MHFCKGCGRPTMFAPHYKGLCFACRLEDTFPMPRCKPPKGQTEPDLKCTECGNVFENKDFEERLLQESQNIPFLCKPCYDKLKNIGLEESVVEYMKESANIADLEKHCRKKKDGEVSRIYEDECEECGCRTMIDPAQGKRCFACTMKTQGGAPMATALAEAEQLKEKEVEARSCLNCAAYIVCIAADAMMDTISDDKFKENVLWVYRNQWKPEVWFPFLDEVWLLIGSHCKSWLSRKGHEDLFPAVTPVITKGE